MWFLPFVVLNILSEELLPEGSKLIREFPWICPECGERNVSDLEDELPITLRCRECSWEASEEPSPSREPKSDLPTTE
jgi:hypothetical protein